MKIISKVGKKQNSRVNHVKLNKHQKVFNQMIVKLKITPEYYLSLSSHKKELSSGKLHD
jgi:hypothetical protein